VHEVSGGAWYVAASVSIHRLELAALTRLTTLAVAPRAAPAIEHGPRERSRTAQADSPPAGATDDHECSACKLEGREPSIQSASRDKLGVRSGVDDGTGVHHDDAIGALYGRKTSG
jgi:hypothetical protein